MAIYDHLERAAFDDQQDLKPHQLEVFCAIAHSLSYVRAASLLHLSQPAVSQQIKALEATLGVRLVGRRGRGITLTPAGEEILPYAERLLKTLRDTGPIVQQIHALERGAITIGASTSAGAYVVPQLLAGFHAAHPDIHLTLTVGNRGSIEEALLTHQVDLAIIGLITHHERFTIEYLMPNDLIMVAAPFHPLAGSAYTPLRQLQSETFLMRERGSGTRQDMERLFQSAGVTLQTGMELNDTGAIKEAAAAGLGLAVVFRQSVERELVDGSLVELQVEGFPLQRRWYVVRLRGGRLSLAASALRQHLLSQAEQMREHTATR